MLSNCNPSLCKQVKCGNDKSVSCRINPCGTCRPECYDVRGNKIHTPRGQYRKWFTCWFGLSFGQWLCSWRLLRCGGLVVSALDPVSRGPGSSPGRVIVLCYWARHFTLRQCLSLPSIKWVPANCQGNLTKCWEVTCDGLAFHPGGVAILLVASCYRNRDKLRQ